MPDNADLKIDRAIKHIVELNELFRKKRPFTYVLETNTKTGQCATYAKKDESLILQAALICGDAVHNIRSALDHTYWYIVSPLVVGGINAVQFPFSETAARLQERVTNRHANKVSVAFFQTLMDLKPHGEAGGNELLYLVHKFGIIDRHKLLIPTADYTRIDEDSIRRQAPDFPRAIGSGNVFGQNYRDVGWNTLPWSRKERRSHRIPASGIFEQILDVPVDIVFESGEMRNPRFVVPTLYQMVEVAKEAIAAMRAA